MIFAIFITVCGVGSIFWSINYAHKQGRQTLNTKDKVAVGASVSIALLGILQIIEHLFL